VSPSKFSDNLVPVIVNFANVDWMISPRLVVVLSLFVSLEGIGLLLVLLVVVHIGLWGRGRGRLLLAKLGKHESAAAHPRSHTTAMLQCNAITPSP
jgi:hypothetical protein